jgi:diphthine-ammonia ligase
MRCVALLSGGKDSVAAIDVARQHGFDVPVALAMQPAADDAWMFHTPNLHVLPAVAEALGMHLVTAPTRGDAEAEVADLESALRRVRDEHGVEAIVSGALASEYQRTRIDRIGHRLGLKTFAPLWHKQPAAHLATVTGPLWDVRVVRAAADGLDARWCGRRLDVAAVGELAALPTRPHIAGEGGEYETLVLDAPGYRSRIVVDEARDEISARRCTWHVLRWHLETKSRPARRPDAQ